MAHPYHHALSSVKKWGGVPEDYQRIHDWFDESKKMMADVRHRALRHHAEGIFMCEAIFGVTLTLSTGKVIPTRWVGEQHVKEDLGRIPSMQDWFRHLEVQRWMTQTPKLRTEDVEIPCAEIPLGEPQECILGKHDLPQRHLAAVPGRDPGEPAAGT